jgi:hypothetical protein
VLCLRIHGRGDILLKKCISSRLWAKRFNDHLLFQTSILYMLRKTTSDCSIDLCGFCVQIYQVCISIKCKYFVNVVPMFWNGMKGDPCCDLSITFFWVALVYLFLIYRLESYCFWLFMHMQTNGSYFYNLFHLKLEHD